MTETYQPISDSEAAFWRDVRREFTLPDDEVYLNTGTLSSIPRQTLDAEIEALRQAERNPTLENILNWGREDAVRERIARYVGARPTGLVFFNNVTIALNALLRGLPLDGGEVILSDQEYTSCVNALHFVAERRHMTVRQFPLPVTPDEPGEVVDAVMSAVSADTRLIYLSHILYTTGMVVPVAQIAREAASRGIMTAVDGAHAPGHISLDLEATDISAYGANLHKWFLGPKGTAFAWVPESLYRRMTPLLVGFGGFLSRASNEAFPPGHAVEFQYAFKMPGCLNFSPTVALAATLDFREAIGEERILRRLRQLAAYCRETVARELGWTLLTPVHPDLSAAISAFAMPNDLPLEGAHPVEWIGAFHRKHRITVSFGAGSPRRLRISPHIYNSESDIDRLVGCLKSEMG